MERGWYIQDVYSLRKMKTPLTSPIFIETGWVFRNRISFPSPEEQARRYLECSNLGNWTPVIFELFEFSPANDVGDILITTELKEFRLLDGYHLWKNCPLVFDSQIQALLQASYFRKAWIALPGLREKGELVSALSAIEKIMDKLNNQRSPFDRYPKIGVKIANIVALRHIEDFSESDFFVLDLDSIFSHFLGIPQNSPMLSYYLEEREEEVHTILEWLEPIPFEEKWCGFISAFPPEGWGKLGQLDWEAYFQRISH
jgi:phosphotransferase system enzyme I (PtsI)